MIVAITEQKQPNVPAVKVAVKTCKKCGGRLARDYEDIACISCGALHDESGRLLKDRIFVPEQLPG